MPELKPVSPEYVAKMNAIAKVLDGTFNGDLEGHDRKVAFVLLITEFGMKPEGQPLNYISNADRADVIATMKEFIAVNEGRYVETPGEC